MSYIFTDLVLVCLEFCGPVIKGEVHFKVYWVKLNRTDYIFVLFIFMLMDLSWYTIFSNDNPDSDGEFLPKYPKPWFQRGCFFGLFLALV